MVRIYGGWQREVSAQDVISFVIVQRNKNIFFTISLSSRHTRSLACSQFNLLVCLRWIKCATERTKAKLREKTYERKVRRKSTREKKRKRNADPMKKKLIIVARESTFFVVVALSFPLL